MSVLGTKPGSSTGAPDKLSSATFLSFLIYHVCLCVVVCICVCVCMHVHEYECGHIHPVCACGG